MDKIIFILGILFLTLSIPCYLFAYNFYFKSTFLFFIALFCGISISITSVRFFFLLIQSKQVCKIPKSNHCNEKNDKVKNQKNEVFIK